MAFFLKKMIYIYKFFLVTKRFRENIPSQKKIYREGEYGKHVTFITCGCGETEPGSFPTNCQNSKPIPDGNNGPLSYHIR